MSPKEPTPEPASDDADGKDDASTDAAATTPGERKPPGPGDVPLSNLPPPAAEQASEADDDEPSDDTVEVPAVVVEADEPSAAEPADAEVEAEGEAAGASGAEGEEAPDAEGEAPSDDEAAADVPEPEVADATAGTEAAADRAARPSPITYTPTPHTRSRLTAVAVVVAVLAGLLALAKAQQVGDLQSEIADRDDIEAVARDFGAAYLSLDYEHPADSAKAVEALSTAGFGESYAAQSAEIQQLATSRQSSTKATTKEVLVGSVSDDAARALVIVDVTATTPGGPEQRLDDVSFTVDLERTSKGWRVAKATRPAQPSLPTTTTTAGAPPP